MNVIVSGTRRLAREELMTRAARAATALTSAGVTEGSAIAMLLRNDLAFLECMVAASLIGAYCVPINWHFTPAEVRYILDDSEARHIVVHADLLRVLRSAIPPDASLFVVPTPPEICAAYGIDAADAEVPAGMRAWDPWIERFEPWSDPPQAMRGSMFYTSGTTGRPKAVRREPVPLSERESYAKLRAEWFGFRPGMRTAMVGPLYHSVQSTYAYASLQAGSVILTPRFDAHALLRLVESERLTHLHLVPTMMQRLVRLPGDVRRAHDLSSLEFVIHGAAPCPPDVKSRIIEWLGPIVHEYYGTSETGMVSRASSEEWLARRGTVGKPWPGRTVRIYDEAGNPLPPRAEGLVYMSLTAMPNFTYHNARDRRSEIERDGLVTTGDIGYLDEDGYLFLCDRRQDLIISGGVKIWPAEIEAALAAHAQVADCAVFAVPDPDLGQVPAAAVQPVAGARVSADELRGFLAARVARFKVPRLFDIRDTLPRDDSGKIFKRLLREPYWQSSASIGE